MTKIHVWLNKFAWYRRFLEMLKNVSLPLFEQVPIYYVLRFLVRELEKTDINLRASAVSFNFFLALFPATIFVFTLVAYIPVKGFESSLLDFLAIWLPEMAYDTVRATILDIVNNQRSALLSFGVLAALYFSTNGVSSLMETFNKTYEIFDSRSFFKQKLIAIGLTIGVTLLLLFALILLGFAPFLEELIQSYFKVDQRIIVWIFLVLNWIIVLTLLLFAFSILYYFGPATNDTWRFISPGSILTTVLFLVTSFGFSYYINNFSSYNKLYGAIGVLPMMMLWMYLNSTLIILGFELNTSVYLNRKRLYKPDNV